MPHEILFSLLQLLDKIQNTQKNENTRIEERKFENKVREIG